MLKKLLAMLLIISMTTVSIGTHYAYADNRFFTEHGSGGGGVDAVGFTLGGALSLLMSLVTGKNKANLNITRSETKQLEIDIFGATNPAGMSLANKLSKSLVRKDNYGRTYEMDQSEGVVHDLDQYMIKVNTKIRVNSAEMDYIESQLAQYKNISSVSPGVATRLNKRDYLYNFIDERGLSRELPRQVLNILDDPDYRYVLAIDRRNANTINIFYYNYKENGIKAAKDMTDTLYLGLSQNSSYTTYYAFHHNDQWYPKSVYAPYGTFYKFAWGTEETLSQMEAKDIYKDILFTEEYLSVTVNGKTFNRSADIMTGDDVVGDSQKVVNIDNLGDDIVINVNKQVIDNFDGKSLEVVNTDVVINGLEDAEAKSRVVGDTVLSNVTLDETVVKEYVDSLTTLKTFEDNMNNNFQNQWDNLNLDFDPPAYILNGMAFVSYVFTSIWNGYGDYITVITFGLTIGLVMMIITGKLIRKKEDEE